MGIDVRHPRHIGLRPLSQQKHAPSALASSASGANITKLDNATTGVSVGMRWRTHSAKHSPSVFHPQFSAFAPRHRRRNRATSPTSRRQGVLNWFRRLCCYGSGSGASAAYRRLVGSVSQDLAASHPSPVTWYWRVNTRAPFFLSLVSSPFARDWRKRNPERGGRWRDLRVRPYETENATKMARQSEECRIWHRLPCAFSLSVCAKGGGFECRLVVYVVGSTCHSHIELPGENIRRANVGPLSVGVEKAIPQQVAAERRTMRTHTGIWLCEQQATVMAYALLHRSMLEGGSRAFRAVNGRASIS